MREGNFVVTEESISDVSGVPLSASDVKSGIPESIYLDLVLLSLRVGLGIIFFAQGMTVFGWFGGTDPPGIGGLEQFLQILGYESTSMLAWINTVVNIGVGVLFIVGLVTPLAAAGVFGIGLNAIFALLWSEGFIAYNAWIGYMSVAVAVAFLGPGRFALDSMFLVRSRPGLRHWLVGPRASSLAIALGVATGIILLTVFGPGFFSEPNFPEFG